MRRRVYVAQTTFRFTLRRFCSSRATTKPSRLPRVSIVGLPNVGKSTLFNKLLRQNKALITPIPGTTRDRLEATCSWNGRTFTLIDTGGIVGEEGDYFASLIQQHSIHAISYSNLIILLFDADAVQGNLTPESNSQHVQMVRLIRRITSVQKIPVLVVINKADTEQLRWELESLINSPKTEKSEQASGSFQLFRKLGLYSNLQGAQGPVAVKAISALHGEGSLDLLDTIVSLLPPRESSEGEAVDDGILRFNLAIVGRPNVGKSSLLNQMTGQERAIVCPAPGTTHDCVDEVVIVEYSPEYLSKVKKERSVKTEQKTPPSIPAVVEKAENGEANAEIKDLGREETEDIETEEEYGLGDENGEANAETKDLGREETEDENSRSGEYTSTKKAEITIVDTAGMRKKGDHEPKSLERMTVMWSLKAIERANVVLMVIDALEGISEQDKKIAEEVLENHKSVVIVVNKWDLIRAELGTHRRPIVSKKEYEKGVRSHLQFMDYVPVVFTSALTGQSVRQTLMLAIKVFLERQKYLPTRKVMEILRSAVARHKMPTKKARKLKVKFMTQARAKVPTFTVFVNSTDLVHFSYKRFLENSIRECYPFLGTPIRLVFRQTQNDSYWKGKQQKGRYNPEKNGDKGKTAKKVKEDKVNA